MPEKGSFGKRLGEFAQQLVFGPETNGTIEAVLQDTHNIHCWHILVKTDQDEQKEFIEFDGLRIEAGKNGIRPVSVNFTEEPKRGDPFHIRTRGKGFTPGLITQIDEDPFHLEDIKARKNKV